MGNKLSRRTLLQTTLAASLATPAIAQGKPEKLVFVGDTGPWHWCLVEEVGPAFEKATGVKVEFTLLPIDALNARVKAELAAGTGGIDIVQWNAISAGWVAPHMEDHAAWIAKAPGPSSVDWDWDDYLPAVKQMSSYEGKLVGIPYRATMTVLHYQKAVLEQAGITRAPETFAEFLAAAQATTKMGAPGRSGYGIMGRQGSAIVGAYQSWMYSNGGKNFDPKTLEIGINQAKSVEALQYFGDLMTKYKVMAPESLTWEYDEIVANGQNDRYAMATTLAPYGTLLNDPKLSKTGGRWTASRIPGAERADQARSVLGGWTFSVPKACKYKELAFEFIQMSTTKAWAERSMDRGNLPPRASVLRRPVVAEKFPWAPAAATTLETATLEPNHPIWPTLEARLRPAISQVLLGERDAKTALDAVAADWQRSLRRANLVKG